MIFSVYVLVSKIVMLDERRIVFSTIYFQFVGDIDCRRSMA